jgi:hypothetical protein
VFHQCGLKSPKFKKINRKNPKDSRYGIIYALRSENLQERHGKQESTDPEKDIQISDGKRL